VEINHDPTNRHAELVSASIVRHNPERGLESGLAQRPLSAERFEGVEKWTLKQVQGDVIGIGVGRA
jgi:hypothetical protein